MSAQGGSTLSQRRLARADQRRVQRSSKLGSGSRFAAVERSAALSGARNPAAVAAAVGRRKFGSKRFAALSAAGRRRKRRGG